MDDEKLLAKVDAALECAKRKHPVFCTKMMSWDYNYYMSKLANARSISEKGFRTWSVELCAKSSIA